jgi:tetratricopeptide (TPR) repeat protein
MKLCFAVLAVLIVFFSQTIPVLSDDILTLADDLSKQGKYDEAITEYKRFIFFNPDYADNAQVFYKMGLAYRAEHNWYYALDTIKTSITLTHDPEIANERRFSLATTLLASGNYSLARLELIRILDSTKDSSLSRKALYFSGIASVYAFDWDATARYFNDFYSDSNNESLKELNLTLKKKSYKSTTTAKVLSVFIPGAGQFYAGNWRDGLNAFVLNGVIIGFTANSIYKKDYKDALLITFLLLYRYYTGNIYRAEMDVEKHNENVDRRMAKEILRIVSPDEP